MLVSEVISLIPTQTKDRVQAALKRYNQVIREAIRGEIRLSFQRRSGNSDDRDESRVQIHLDKIGYPEEFKRLSISPDFELAALLSLYLPTLNSLRDSSCEIGRMVNQQSRKLAVLPKFDELCKSLPGSFDLAELLLKEVGRFSLVKEILYKIDEGILGYYSHSGDSISRHSGSGEIGLYWGSIGLCSCVLGVDIEALTALVIAHELGHAYTHLGFDIDEHRWSDVEFKQTDQELREGLAQYYAARTMERLQIRIPGGITAFQKLLDCQPPVYQFQEEWRKKASAEAVRSVFVRVRKQGPGRIADFDNQLINEVFSQEGKNVQMERKGGKANIGNPSPANPSGGLSWE